MLPPAELQHAERHLAAARAELAGDRLELAAVHLREAIADAGWTLYGLTAALLVEPSLALLGDLPRAAVSDSQRSGGPTPAEAAPRPPARRQ